MSRRQVSAHTLSFARADVTTLSSDSDIRLEYDRVHWTCNHWRCDDVCFRLALIAYGVFSSSLVNV